MERIEFRGRSMGYEKALSSHQIVVKFDIKEILLEQEQHQAPCYCSPTRPERRASKIARSSIRESIQSECTARTRAQSTA